MGSCWEPRDRVAVLLALPVSAGRRGSGPLAWPRGRRRLAGVGDVHGRHRLDLVVHHVHIAAPAGSRDVVPVHVA